MEDAFRLRYQVYCREKHFLAADDYPEGIEFDEFDQDATHLLVYGADRHLLGYMRLVSGADGALLPMIAHGLTINSEYSIPADEHGIEISRMIVRTDVRHAMRPATDVFPNYGQLPPPNARTASDLIQLKLLRLTYHRAISEDARWIFAAMEPTLHRRFRMIGMPFAPIGPPGDYYGQVQPYAMDIRHMEHNLEQRFPNTAEFFNMIEPDPDVRVIFGTEWQASPAKHAA